MPSFRRFRRRVDGRVRERIVEDVPYFPSIVNETHIELIGAFLFYQNLVMTNYLSTDRLLPWRQFSRSPPGLGFCWRLNLLRLSSICPGESTWSLL